MIVQISDRLFLNPENIAAIVAAEAFDSTNNQWAPRGSTIKLVDGTTIAVPTMTPAEIAEKLDAS